MQPFKTVTELKNYLAKVHDQLRKGECPEGFEHCLGCNDPNQASHLTEGYCGTCWRDGTRERNLPEEI